MYCVCIVNRHIGVLNVLRVLDCRWVYYSEKFSVRLAFSTQLSVKRHSTQSHLSLILTAKQTDKNKNDFPDEDTSSFNEMTRNLDFLGTNLDGTLTNLEKP